MGVSQTKGQGLDTDSNSSSTALLKRAYKVIKESSNQIIIGAPNLMPGQKIMFVRLILELDEYEIISHGVVKRATEKMSLITLDLEKNEKFPKVGDFAVVSGEPKTFVDPVSQKTKSEFMPRLDTVNESETGYASIAWSLNQGELKSTSSNRANSYKNIKNFDYNGFNFTWVPEFQPSYGLDVSSYGGNIQVLDYFSEVKPSSLNSTEFKIFYRNFFLEKKMIWAFQFGSTSMNFSTENEDEYIFSSTANGIGLGFSLAYQFNQLIIHKNTPLYGIPQALKLGFFYVPSLSVSDIKNISRGTSSSGSSQLSYEISYSHLFYVDKIPWFKRYFLEFKFRNDDFKINFSGPTKNSFNNFYTIPENGKYTENNSFIRFAVGLMLEDWFGKSLKPRDR